VPQLHSDRGTCAACVGSPVLPNAAVATRAANASTASRAKMGQAVAKSQARDAQPKSVATVAKAQEPESDVCVATLDGKLLPLFDMYLSERYFTILECAGRTFSFARVEPQDDLDQFGTTMRDLALPGVNISQLPSGISSNAAFTCVNNETVYAYGGNGDFGGVRIMRADATERFLNFTIEPTTDPEGWPQLVANANPDISGCIERFLNNMGEVHMCAFDGQMSVVHWRENVVMFGRANICPEGGGRHVQVAIGESDGTTFGRFQELRFEGWDLLTQEQLCANNIYLFVPIVVRDTLFGIFPAIIPATNESGIFCSSTEDAFTWTTPTLMYHSPPILDSAGHPVRTRDWPVNMQYGNAEEAEGSRVSLNIYVEHGIYMHHLWETRVCSESYEAATNPRVCGYGVTVDVASSTPICKQLAEHFRSAPDAPEEWIHGQEEAEDCERDCQRAHTCEVGGEDAP